MGSESDIQSNPGQINKEIFRRTKTLVFSLKSPYNLLKEVVSRCVQAMYFGISSMLGMAYFLGLIVPQFPFDIRIFQVGQRDKYGFQPRHDILFRLSEIMSHVPSEMKQIRIFQFFGPDGAKSTGHASSRP